MSDTMNKTGAAILAESLDVPDEAYQRAAARYNDIGQWLSDQSRSASARFKPRISVQGSFRLGTPIKPLGTGEYDLDLACTLQEGISMSSHSQMTLKNLVGADLERYRLDRGIKEGLDEKNRCWRLHYQDHVNFHIDTTPAIPFDPQIQVQLRERMVKAGLRDALAQTISERALGITDKRLPNYSQISPEWKISNPEGYALWFESRMRQASKLLESRAFAYKVASIDELPAYRWKTPLQQAIQMLKRHRDIMFRRNPDGRPISIIITTLAAQAYNGETDLQFALDGILAGMGSHIRSAHPRVPNPVNPAEDFADKWATAEGRRLQLEHNFHAWLTQARVDFGHVAKPKDRGFFEEQAQQKFGASVNEAALSGLFGRPAPAPRPVIHRIQDAPRPWLK